MIEIECQSDALTEADRTTARRICGQVDSELRSLLPSLADPVHVYLETGKQVIPKIGIGATALTPDSLSFRLDPDHPAGPAALLQNHLRETLFHECHHLVRGWVKRGGLRPRYLIEAVICEGLASAFQRDAADSVAPWCSYPSDVREWVDELLQLPMYAPYTKWMFWHPDGRKWVGYRAGVYIADRAIAASGRSAAQLAETDYREILRLADLPLPTRQPIAWRMLARYFMHRFFRRPRA